MAYPAGNHWSGDTEDRKALLLAETAARETLSPVERLEIMLHPWVGFAIMPLFAFANGLQEPEESRYGSCICRIRTWQAHGYLSWGLLAAGGLLAASASLWHYSLPTWLSTQA